MGAQILIIEDNPANLELMSYLLQSFGHTTQFAKDGAQGLLLARSQWPQLIVCDIHLPDTDGYAIAQQLKADPACARIPLIAVTALAMVGDRDKVLAAGFDGYISKPIDPESFVEQVQSFLGDRNEGTRNSPTVLVVDDDPSARELIATVLGYANYQVRQASDGLQALTMAQAEPLDLIIVDLLMPTMDGFEFVRRLRQTPGLGPIPVIFYTATYLESEARNLATACGVKDILTKPAEPQEILDSVARNLGRPCTVAAPPPVEEFRQQHLGVLLAKLSQRAATVGPRLDALFNIGLQLATERDPQRLLGELCSAARKMIGSKYVVVGIWDKAKERILYEASSGMSPESATLLAGASRSEPLPPNALTERRPHRLGQLSGDPCAVGLPQQHPAVHSFLCAPISSPDRVYGWLYLTDKLGTSEFSEDDEGLAQILAAQVGRIYENGLLYAEVKGSLAKLEAEFAERRRAEEEVQRLNAQLEQRVRDRTIQLEEANKELEAFSYSVSHDLRAPLRAIHGFARIVREDHATALGSEGQRLMETVCIEAQRMGKLIDDLLTFSRLGRQTLSVSLVDMTSLVEATFNDLTRAIALKPRLEVQQLPEARGDRALLRQVFSNLLSNAIKFSSRSEAPAIQIGGGQSAGHCNYFVKDNGVGFDEAYRHKLFGVFQRLHSEEVFEGTGVGLALVDRIIRRHGGKVWAESKVNQGATFYFSLPSEPDPSHG